MSCHHRKHFLQALLSWSSFLSVLPFASMSSVALVSSHGFDFQVGTFSNFAASNLQLVVGTLPGCEERQTSFVIESLNGVIHSGFTSSNNPMYINISDDFIVSSSEFSDRQKGIHVYSTGEYPISVLLVNHGELTYGEYLAQPLEKEEMQMYTYHAISMEPFGSKRSVILLVARDNDTTVTVTSPVDFSVPVDAQAPSTSISIRSGNPHIFVLHRLQTYMISSTQGDLTGAKIESEKPLNVISGHECGLVPTPCTLNCEQLSKQLPPTSQWGREFLLIPLAGRTVGQYYKVVSSQDSTTVSCSCVCSQENAMQFTISSVGDYHQFHTDSSTYCYLIATKPVLIAQLQPGAEYSSSSNSLGDPTMTILPALEQYPNEVNAIPLRYTDFEMHYINIAVTKNSVLLDNTLISADQWTEIKYNGQLVGYGIQMHVSAIPVHHVKHTNPMYGVGVMAYGYGTLTSYSYIAGTNLKGRNSSKKTHYGRNCSCNSFSCK